MPLPIAPIAGIALRYSAVALTTYAVSRKLAKTTTQGRRDQRAEDALDGLHDGATLRHESGQTNATARFRRKIRLGANGLGVEIDMTALGRFTIRKL